MKYLTNDIYRFSGRSRIALAIVSATVFAGFTWPFYVQTQSSAHFAQYFFWAAVPASIFLLIAQLSDSGLDAKSVALLGTLAALLAARFCFWFFTWCARDVGIGSSNWWIWSLACLSTLRRRFSGFICRFFPRENQGAC